MQSQATNHDVMVILTPDGKPITVIKSKEDELLQNCRKVTRNDSIITRNMESEKQNMKSIEDNNSVTTKNEKDVFRHKDSDENVQLRRLKSENHLLKDRIEYMEKERTVSEFENIETMDELRKQNEEMTEREINLRNTIEYLMTKIKEMKTRQEKGNSGEICHEMDSIHDELVASKLREAEANSAFKELQQKLHQLEKQWQHFLGESNREERGGGGGGGEMMKKSSHLELMALRIKETCLVSELNEIKQRLMELETQNHVIERQAKRQEIENSRLLEKIVSCDLNEKEMKNTIKNFEHKINDLESKQKEDVVLLKIHEAEFCQTIAEMRRKIAELEIENQELMTSAQLHNKDHDMKELENRIIELQDEVFQLKLQMSSDEAEKEMKRSVILTDNVVSHCDIMTESFLDDANSMCLQLPTEET